MTEWNMFKSATEKILDKLMVFLLRPLWMGEVERIVKKGKR